MPANAEEAAPIREMQRKREGSILTSKRDTIVRACAGPVTAGGLSSASSQYAQPTRNQCSADTLFRQPATSGLQPLQKRGGDGASRELTTPAVARGGTSAHEYVSPTRRPWSFFSREGHVRPAGPFVAVCRSGVFTERATALYLPPGMALTVTADHAPRSGARVDSGDRVGSAGARVAGRGDRQSARTRQLRARGPRHLRRDPTCKPADGGRDLQSARALEQFPAAQARRKQRRADSRGGLLLPIDPPQGLAIRCSTPKTASR